MTETPCTITLNGESRNIAPGTTVTGLFALLELSADGLLVERNRTIVPRSTFETQILEPGDAIEIMRLIGGG
ncbi:MAG: sulfur carrier protein ThiS [bacterium]